MLKAYTERSLQIIILASLSIVPECKTRHMCEYGVNTCVTEKRNVNNAPEMFYTPNRDDYIQQISVNPGM